MRRLKECNGQLNECPWIGASSLVEYELVDIFFRIMPHKFHEDFHKANESLHNHTLDSSCYHIERLETLQSLGETKGEIKKSDRKGYGKNGKNGKPKKDAQPNKRLCEACKEAGKPYRVHSSHNTNQCRGQGRNLRNNNPNLNKEFKKQISKMMASAVRKELKRKRQNESDEESG